MNQNYHKGRGAQVNPENQYIKNQRTIKYLEGVDDFSENEVKTLVYSDSSKNILSKNNSPDIPFNYSINPYQGCEHGCVYCYARNTHTYWGFSAGLDWESRIIVKENAAELLEKAFLKKSWQPETIILSGNTDPYQPLERKLEITRSILKIFLKFRNPVGIITKNSLIARDIDLLSELAANNLVRVLFSITTLDEKLRRILEPRSANAEKMLATMQKLSEVGVPVGVMIGPVIPSINDSEIDQILRRAYEHGASAANYTIARFNGDIGEIFRDWLAKNFPDRADKVWHKVQAVHGGKVSDSRWGTRMKGEGNYSILIRDMFHKLRVRYGFRENIIPLNTKAFRRNGTPTLFDDYKE